MNEIKNKNVRNLYILSIVMVYLLWGFGVLITFGFGILAMPFVIAAHFALKSLFLLIDSKF